METGQCEEQRIAELTPRDALRAGTPQVIVKEETSFLPKVAFTLITVASMAGSVFTGTGSGVTGVGLGSPGTLLDIRHTPRAIGLIRAATRMRELSPGALLEIWSRDHFAPMEIPLWAERDGYKVVIRSRAGAWPRRYHVFVITKPIR
ncbi:MAG: sulfurtransferase TusA family protein [Jiangellaceae bacterium]